MIPTTNEDIVHEALDNAEEGGYSPSTQSVEDNVGDLIAYLDVDVEITEFDMRRYVESWFAKRNT